MKCKTCGGEFDPLDVLNNDYCTGPCAEFDHDAVQLAADESTESGDSDG